MHASAVLSFFFAAICTTMAYNSSTPLMTAKCNKPPAMPLQYCGKNGYYFSDNMKTGYFNAMAFCRRHGMDLVSIESEDEQNCIVSHIKALGLAHANFWTSGNDWEEAKKFVWMGTGQRLAAQNYTAWSGNEPSSDWFKGELVPEHCLSLWAEFAFRWNDARCTNQMLFICEIRLTK